MSRTSLAFQQWVVAVTGVVLVRAVRARRVTFWPGRSFALSWYLWLWARVVLMVRHVRRPCRVISCWMVTVGWLALVWPVMVARAGQVVLTRV
ncbi:MAG: hypothetical protein Q8P61_00715, partial [Candidatus Nanopelagicales bacterium]|nr:hypothetical protein [Candidatus Nanopelagicales bacterium]